MSLVLTQDQDKAVLYIDGEIDGEASTGDPVRMDLVKNGISLGGHTKRKRFWLMSRVSALYEL